MKQTILGNCPSKSNCYKVVTMNNSEHDLQTSCVNWFRYQYPKYRDLLFAIPNGGKRNVVTARKLKAEGVLSGVPDLCIAISKHGYHGFYIEMKTGKNKPTDNQINIMEKLKREGYKCEVCYSVEQFVCVVKDYMN